MIFNIFEFLNFSFIFSVSIFSLMFYFRTKDKYIKLCLWMILSTLVFHLLIVGQIYFTAVTLAYPGVYFTGNMILKAEGLVGGFIELLLVSLIVFSSSHYFFHHLRMDMKSKKTAYIVNVSLNAVFLIVSSVLLVGNHHGESWKFMTHLVQYQIFPFASLFIGLNGLTAWLMRHKADTPEMRNEMKMIARNFTITLPLALIDIFLLRDTLIRLSFIALTPFFLHVFFHLSRYYYINYESLPSEKDMVFNMEKLGLTEREREIASLIITGDNYSNIGETLFISINTVKTHTKNIYRKTGVSNRTQLNYKLRAPNPSG